MQILEAAPQKSDRGSSRGAQSSITQSSMALSAKPTPSPRVEDDAENESKDVSVQESQDSKSNSKQQMIVFRHDSSSAVSTTAASVSGGSKGSKESIGMLSLPVSSPGASAVGLNNLLNLNSANMTSGMRAGGINGEPPLSVEQPPSLPGSSSED